MHMKSTDRHLAIALLLLLFSVYLVTYSGTLHSSDGQAMFSVSESLVRRGAYDINQIRWMGLQQGTFGQDGSLYCRKGPGTSLVALPLTWLGLAVPAWGLVQTTMLLNALITALTAALIFTYVRRLGYRQTTGLVTALIFGLGTIAWPYAKYFFSEPLTGLCLLAAAYFTLPPDPSTDEGPPWPACLFVGFFLGLAVATRFANAVLLPIYAGLLVFYLLRRRGLTNWSTLRSTLSPLLSAVWRQLFAWAFPLLLWGALLAAYNYLRFGDPLMTGYLPEESFSAPWVTGILGLLVSPGRGLIFFCPVLLACLPAWPRLYRRHREQGVFILLTAASYVLLYGKWFMWHGGFAWGPRFLLPIIPLLCVILAPLVEGLSGKTRAVLWGLLAVSAAVQVPGLTVHFIHHQEALLQTGLPLFDPVTFFDPRYGQLWGTLAFLKPENLDFAWVQTSSGLTIDWLSLAASLLLVLSCGSILSLVARQPVGRQHGIYVFVLLPLLLVGGTALLLARYKNDGHTDYVQMLQSLQASSEPDDAIIQNSPPETAVFQNHYKGHLPSYGLFEGEGSLSDDTLALLHDLAARHPRIWVIPGDLPPLTNSLDLWFVEQGWSAEHRGFGSERLTLYTRP
jgi:hypothetical protein